MKNSFNQLSGGRLRSENPLGHHRKGSLKNFSVLIWLLTVVLCILLRPIIGSAQSVDSFKIGVYDSRIIVMAYSQSDYFLNYMKDFGQKSDSAKKANDTLRIKELSIHAMSFQHLLHQMVFGSGSAAWVMELVKDKLPGVAEKAGVSVIVSKFELTWYQPGIDLVDVTVQIAGLFNPKGKIDQMVNDIGQQNPIPLPDLSIEYEMLDAYCLRFGKK